jgi:glycosyltransferase involved in cell wall biosynthesis
MSDFPLISICIPAFKRVFYLRRLLDSILAQTYKNFEVVITDDSPTNEVADLVARYKDKFHLSYHRNPVPLGSPRNWNAAIKIAKGKWIKIMHDDDWFSEEYSLNVFANAISEFSHATFFFSGFNEIDLDMGTKKTFVINRFYLSLLKNSPLTLLKRNFIGHPSTTLIKNDSSVFFDENLKWVVDLEFYIRYLGLRRNFRAIRMPLINIGVNVEQITKEAFRNPSIEIPEMIYLLENLPKHALRNLFVYDYCWRFIRNLSIRSVDDVKKYAPHTVVPAALRLILKHQTLFATSLVKIGPISKTLMSISYLLNYSKL